MTNHATPLKSANYPLIPMSEITDEARKIAIAWAECEDRNWIGNKHKLASDIMNYATQQLAEKNREVEGLKAKIYDLNKIIDNYKINMSTVNDWRKESDARAAKLEEALKAIKALDVSTNRNSLEFDFDTIQTIVSEALTPSEPVKKEDKQ